MNGYVQEQHNYFAPVQQTLVKPAPEASSQPYEMLDDSRLASVIEQCQSYFWGNSAYAVLFCLLRDEYGMPDNMSLFETRVEQLHYTRQRDYVCPKGTLSNAFSDNKIYKIHVSRWKGQASKRIMILLEQLRRQLEL